MIRLDPRWPENRPRLGLEAARSFFDDLTTMVGTGDTVVEDVVDAGDRVLIRNRSRIHGRQSGIEDEVVFTQLVTFRRARIVMLEYFLDHSEALQVAGLSE